MIRQLIFVCYHIFVLPNKLVEDLIEKRRGQFIIIATIGDTTGILCHCPTTGRIGNISLTGRPCLLSPSDNSDRKTKYTVEAISLNKPKDSNKIWIGINQNAANRYVAYYLRNDGFFDHQKAILLCCFIYDNPGFEVIDKSENYDKVRKVVDNAQKRGVEFWQVNFKINVDGVELMKYFQIHP